VRLFTTWTWLFSNSDEDTVSAVSSALQSQRQKTIKQTIPFADAGSTTITPASVYTVPWVSATSSRSRLLDLSVNGNCYVKITQDGVERSMEIKGTTKTPARLTISLRGTVSVVTITSRESTANVSAQWMYAEFTDITSKTYFPVV
jgi:hypothetical protein